MVFSPSCDQCPNVPDKLDGSLHRRLFGGEGRFILSDGFFFALRFVVVDDVPDFVFSPVLRKFFHTLVKESRIYLWE